MRWSARSTRVAAGDGEVPPDLLGRLLEQVGRLQRQVLAPRGLAFSGLTPREIEVLRLVAEGHDTVRDRRTVCYSERTVKNVLHDLTTGSSCATARTRSPTRCARA